LVALSAFDTSKEYVELDYPAHWPEPAYDFARNPITAEGVALGRALFYDPILSLDSSVTCANCHLSYTAFTHVDHALSHGIGDSIGTRNSMALSNLAWSTSFMWDGAVNHLDMQALAPISHRAEMGEEISHVIAKLKRNTTYPDVFASVYGDDEITGERLLKALSQFQLTLISANSKYDAVMAPTSTVVFDPIESKGYALFKTHCNSCHVEPLFTNYSFQNNGLRPDSILDDKGRAIITQRAEDSYTFKVPSLRNIEYSRPYMHDGRFEKLEQVYDHYEKGIIASKTLAPELAEGINLNADERVELTAFLLTLSDREFLFNPDHAYPR